MARIGPGQLVEALDGDPTVAVVVELALVNDVGGFLAVLGDYVVGGEARRGGFELVEAELGEARARVFVGFAAPILCNNNEHNQSVFLFSSFKSKNRKKTEKEQKGGSLNGYRGRWIRGRRV